VPKFTLVQPTSTALADTKATAVIIGVIKDDQLRLALGATEVDEAFGGEFVKILTALGASGKAEETTKVPAPQGFSADVILAVGLGKSDETGGISAEQVRRASGAASRALKDTSRVLTTLSVIDLRAAVEGTALGAYSFTEYRSKSDKKDNGDKKKLSTVEVLSPPEGTDKEHRAIVKAGVAIAESVVIARDLINTPPNDLFPESFASRAKKLAEDNGLDFEVLDEKALKRKGFGGILGVGGGSVRPPRLVRLAYRGPKAVKKVALVGKGITFDSGGISIKPAPNMDQMTADMSGAAGVLAATVLAAKLKYPLEIVSYLPLAENLPSGSSYRPGDVLTMYGGKTVEILNTDAEGRIVLADAIVRAAEDKPDYLIEVSTLTGAQVIALGTRTAGIMGSDEFRDRLAGIAQATGEGGWAMPMPEELRADLDSRLADIANVASHRLGGMLAAGLFLREFIPEGLSWAHVDIAGPAFNTGSPWGYTAKGGTGVPVRSLAAVLADIASNG
jgi:leucyl aminopeptidase